MQRVNYLFNIEAEQNDSILIKILTAIIRRRIPLISFVSDIRQNEGLLYIMFLIEETDENAEKFLKQLDKQVDILSVTFFEHKTEQCLHNNLPGVIHSLSCQDGHA